jgi:rhodanese-related sulfurtransferase
VARAAEGDDVAMSIAIEHFSRRLEVETDVSDVALALESGEADFVILDSRGRTAYDAGHLPGAQWLPELTAETVASLPDGEIVVYCWGPSCNGACKAALKLARLGRPVKEMLGGFEYWARDGHPVETS